MQIVNMVKSEVHNTSACVHNTQHTCTLYVHINAHCTMYTRFQDFKVKATIIYMYHANMYEICLHNIIDMYMEV